MKLRIIIADDEKLARDSINTLLSVVEGWEIISECKNGVEVLNAINNFNPDLVFLDIQMPKLNGLEVIKSIKSKNLPYFILVTAYDSYAIQAFELSALDYLLKPYTDKRFYQALEKAEREIKLRKDQFSDIIKALENII